jgi:hypothetical protein
METYVLIFAIIAFGAYAVVTMAALIAWIMKHEDDFQDIHYQIPETYNLPEIMTEIDQNEKKLHNEN